MRYCNKNTFITYKQYKMKTFMFYQKNSSACLTISALTFEEAETELCELVKDIYGWRVEDEDGEDEDENI